eukprot:TRINITY_DN34103_c1_g1_i1.p1 TRINITY_DN34103_c1_g1~~TRINITY_DN34103_c1_g1_i1.p1  ORF type:complete len:369 (+),score=84.11 TRINITY_DN34103_c1_g1_i1:71-1177(+)
MRPSRKDRSVRRPLLTAASLAVASWTIVALLHRNGFGSESFSFGSTWRSTPAEHKVFRHAAEEASVSDATSTEAPPSGGKCPFSKENMAMSGAPDAEEEGLIPGERYIAMNRFRVKNGCEAKFEQRWATRESSLTTLDGFRWFCLLRRVPGTKKGGSMSVIYNYEDDSYEDDYSYLSFTIWETKKNFNSWRTGPAFKEAHGGGGIANFVSMVVNGFMTSNGPPKPAFWRSMLLEKTPEQKTRLVGGPGGQPDADGENVLEPEIYAVMNRFTVKEGMEAEFEKRWADRESKLKEQKGFRFFHLMRRDQTPDDTVNYISMSVWDSREDFDDWWGSKSFTNMAQVQGNLLEHPLTRMFYEGKLVLESESGA